METQVKTLKHRDNGTNELPMNYAEDSNNLHISYFTVQVLYVFTASLL